MAHVYGDSTPFPYDMDYIELLRGAVDCAVRLLSAQHAIDTTHERSCVINEQRRAEELRLSRVEDNVHHALRGNRKSDFASVARLAERISRDAELAVTDELEALQAETLSALDNNQRIASAARESAARALGTFLIEQEVPETGLCLTLVASGESFRTEVVLRTPFGVGAACTISPPSDHGWLKPRRVGSICPESVLYLPRAHTLWKRGEQLQATSLDRYFVSEVTLDETHALITLRKKPDRGSGYRIGIAYEDSPRAMVSPVLADGSLDATAAVTLGGKDNAKALRLMRRIADSARDLVEHRSAATSIVFENQPVTSFCNPGSIARRLIATVAPVAIEAARRSGAPGELVIRRDLGQGRREELYVTKSELLEKTQSLPPEYQVEFEPLGLDVRPSIPATQPLETAALSA